MNFNFITNIESCYYDISPLIYYSHLTGIVISLFLSIFIIFKNRTLLGKLLFFTSITFSLWVLSNLIIWITHSGVLTIFFWSLLGLLYGFIYISSLYFIYIFIDKKDISFNKKIIFGLLLLPIIILTPTIFNLESFDTTNCNAIESGYFQKYYYGVGFLVFLWILVLAINKYRKSEESFKKQIIYLAVGIEAFLFSFFIAGIITSYLVDNGYLENYNLEQYGLFGMTFFIGILTFMIVKFKTFNIKLIATQALMTGLIILIGSQFFFIQNPVNKILNGITLILSIIGGWILVKSVKKEVRQREELLVMTKMFQAANKQLDELNKFKSEFLSFASHQIKAPMAIIKGFAELLYSGSFGQMPDSAKDAVLKIKQSTKNLVELVNDFLDLRKIEEGKMQFNFEEVDVVGLAKEIIGELNILATDKKLELKSELSQEEIKIKADKQKIRQVIVNLIENSIKYTESGWVKCKASKIENQNQKEVLIEVSDSGIGISKDTIDHIFEEFVRASTETVKHIKGTGLGLYIAKKIVDAHGGKIWAESEGEGKGSRFYVRLKAES